MPSTPIPLPPDSPTEWIETGPAVLFLFGSGTALVEYTTEGGPDPRWIASEVVAMGRAFPLDATAAGCRLRLTNKGTDEAAYALAEDPRR